MIVSVFHIEKMDCPSEEEMVRMQLAPLSLVHELRFDLNQRSLMVYHEEKEGTLQSIEEALDSLHLGSRLTESTRVEGELPQHQDQMDRRLLWSVLLINVSFFALEVVAGLLARSMGLVADSLDMLADGVVYGLSLYAISGTLIVKRRVARVSGVFQLLLAGAGFTEVIRRVIMFHSLPDSYTMMGVSLLALGGNVASLILLRRSRNQEVHIQASQIFTSNDVIANLGVIGAGLLVMILNSPLPDLIVGFLVFAYVMRGAVRILQLAREVP